MIVWLPGGTFDNMKPPAASVRVLIVGSLPRDTEAPVNGWFVDASTSLPVTVPVVG